MKSIFCLVGVALFLFLMPGAAQTLKKGFVTFSEGDQGARTLKYRAVTDGALGPVKTIVEKGEAGGDIQGNISFDGKWIAFARKNAAKCPKKGDQWNGNGEDDYHKFHCFDPYIARIDTPENFPVKAIKIRSEGYWPSWGTDSYGDKGPTKTLYFGVWTLGEIWKTTVNEDGTFSDPVKHDAVPGWKNGDHHMQCAPNGKLIAIRYGGSVSVVGIDGNKHNVGVGGGCHPSWFADSKHLYHAKSWVGNIDGDKLGSAANYHFGSSSNLKWAITLSSGISDNAQSNGKPVKFGPVEYNFTDSAIVKVGPYNSEEVTAKGNFMDIHDFEGLPEPAVSINSKLPAPANLKIELKGGQLIVNTKFSGAHTIELYDINGIRKAHPVKSQSSRTVISVKDYPEGIYILRVNSEGKTAQKKLTIM